jgi:hypothetical protein
MCGCGWVEVAEGVDGWMGGWVDKDIVFFWGSL